MIEKSEFAVLFLRGFIVGARRFFLRGEAPKKSVVFPGTDLRHPLAAIERHAFVPRLVARINRSIGEVLRGGTWAEIAPPVIEGVAVGVIGRIASNYGVHVNRLAMPFRHLVSDRVEATGCPRQGAPIPLRQPLKIGGVHNSVLTFCKRDESDRFVLRLDNFVSRYTGLAHGLTSNEIVRRSAAFPLYESRFASATL